MAYRGKAGVHQSPVVSARYIGLGEARMVVVEWVQATGNREGPRRRQGEREHGHARPRPTRRTCRFI